MKIKNLILATTLICFQTKAQNYKAAIGGKLGYGATATYKTFLNTSNAIDVFAGITWGSGFIGGAYFQKHKDIASVKNLQWYYGGGVNFSTWQKIALLGGSYYEIGIAPNLGLDYKLENYPINISADWAPTFVVLVSRPTLNRN